MATVRVTGVQMVISPNQKENLPRILDYIKNCDSDVAVFPEMSLTGYHNKFSDNEVQEACRLIANACRQSYTTAIIGTGAREDGRVYIQSRVYSDEGALLGTQEKLVPTSSDREWCRPGEELRTFQHRNITFGCLICNDLWVTPGFGPYPDMRLSYQLAQKGVHAIFHTVNSGTSPAYAAYHEANLRLRAAEAKCPIVTVNAAVPGKIINAPSGVVSPKGEWLAQCPLEGEHTFSYDLELDTE